MTNKVAKVMRYEGKPAQITELEDGGISLAFDKKPALIFVSYDGDGRYDDLIIDGEKSVDHYAINIESSVDSMTVLGVEKFVCVREDV